jgi:hypothetical protein
VVTRSPRTEEVGIEGTWQLVHVEDVLAKATDVLAHVEAEARDQTRGNGPAVFGHTAGVQAQIITSGNLMRGLRPNRGHPWEGREC